MDEEAGMFKLKFKAGEPLNPVVRKTLVHEMNLHARPKTHGSYSGPVIQV